MNASRLVASLLKGRGGGGATSHILVAITRIEERGDLKVEKIIRTLFLSEQVSFLGQHTSWHSSIKY